MLDSDRIEQHEEVKTQIAINATPEIPNANVRFVVIRAAA